MDALSHATTSDKADVYAGLGLHLTYDPGPRTVVEIGSDMYERVVSEVRVAAYVHACDHW